MTYEKNYRKRILNFYYENGKTKDFGCGKDTVRVALKKLGYTRKKTDKIQAAGHFLLFLPLYSLNLNPIENIKKTPKIFIILSVLYYL